MLRAPLPCATLASLEEHTYCPSRVLSAGHQRFQGAYSHKPPHRVHLPRALYYTTSAKPARPKGWKAVLVMAPVEMANTARQGSGLRATGRVLAIPNGATGNGEERRGGVE
jgi:hypothetical protein